MTTPPNDKSGAASDNDASDYDIAPAFAQSHTEANAARIKALDEPVPVKAQEPQSKKLLWIILGTLLGFGLIFAIIGAFLGVFTPSPTPAPNPVPAPVVTATAEPTEEAPTEEPTETPSAEPTEGVDADLDPSAEPTAGTGQLPVFDTDAERDAYFVSTARAAYPMEELSDQQLAGVSKKTCQRLEAGESVGEIYQDILSLPTTLATDTSNAFGSGVGFYCTDYIEQYQDYMNSPVAEVNELPKVEIPSFN